MIPAQKPLKVTTMTSMKNFATLVGASAICCIVAASGAQAGDYCSKKYQASAGATQSKYQPQIALVYDEIKKVQDAGLEPNKYLVPFEGELVTLVQKANNLVVRYRAEMSRSAGENEGCASAIAPANMLVNGSIKASLIWATSGLSLLLPDHMTNVDVGEIAHGKPFGSDSAILPEVRELLLQGDNGTIANIVRDPWKCISFQRKC